MDDQLEIWVEGQSRDHARMIVPKGYIVTGKAVVDRNTGKRMWKAVRCDDPANLVDKGAFEWIVVKRRIEPGAPHSCVHQPL